jgi:ferrous iron transport protein A
MFAWFDSAEGLLILSGCGQGGRAQATANKSQAADSEDSPVHLICFTMTTNGLTPNPETRLDVLPARQCAVVRRIETEGDDVQRLKTLGICVGRRLEVVRTGDPLVVRVFGSRLGLSASLASRVWLEVCTPDHCAMREAHEHE